MVLSNLLQKHDFTWPERESLNTLQVNLGRMCNMTCSHCHVNAGPNVKEVMDYETMNRIIDFLSINQIRVLDLTGGAPEMAPCFKTLARRAKNKVDDIIVRCNLTILHEPEMEDLPDFYREVGARLVCSLPCYSEENVDAQRGAGTFRKSIDALKKLNVAGYGVKADLKLDLVYNPSGPFLPGNQKSLETEYKTRLLEDHGVRFNNLITITNMPVNRFMKQLKGDEYQKYISLLADSFNPDAVNKIMCKQLLSVGWDGALYDCDFNQAMNKPIRNESGKTMKIDALSTEDLTGRQLACEDHCLGCVAGEGSSCSGALI